MAGRKKQVVSYEVDVTNPDDIQALVDSLTRQQKRLLKADGIAGKKYLTLLKSKIFAPMLRALRVYPGKAKHPIRWKSEKQRRYVMMLLRAKAIEAGRKPDENGHLDIHYERTGKLAKGWKYSIELLPSGGYRARIWNDASSYDPIKKQTTLYSRFVVGDIGLGKSERSASRYAEPIQPFHEDTGWKPAQPIIAEYADKAIERSAEIYKGVVLSILSE